MNTRAIDSPWMTPAECAEYLRFVDTDGKPDLVRLYHARSRRGLPACTMGGGRSLRFHRQHVDAWMEDPEAARPRVTRVKRERPAPTPAASDRAYGSTSRFQERLADARAQMRRARR